jgi:hypothetical protein
VPDLTYSVRPTRRILLPLIVAASAATACTEPSASPRLSVSYSAEGAYADPALFRAEITQGGERRVVQAWQIIVRSRSSTRVDAGADGFRLHVGEVATVRLAIVLAPGDTAAAGSVSWTPEPHWRYGVNAVVGRQRPGGFCIFAVEHAIRLPVRGGTEGDTLFVFRSGLPDGAVC